MNEIESKTLIQRINKIKLVIWKKTSKISKVLAILTNRKIEKTQTDKIRGEKRNTTVNTNDVYGIIVASFRIYLLIN